MSLSCNNIKIPMKLIIVFLLQVGQQARRLWQRHQRIERRQEN